MEFEKILELLKDPISGKIFKNPVIAEDGEVYEAGELELWFETNGNISPKTKKYMTSETVFVIPLKSIINELFEKNPDLKTLQYEGNQVLYSFSYNKSKILDKLKNGNYNDLLNYKKFSLHGIGINGLVSLLQSNRDDIIKHVFTNCYDLNVLIPSNYDNNNCKLINCIAKYGTTDILKFIIDLGCNINNPCESDGMTPLHQTAERKSYSSLKLLVENGANLFAINANGISALAFILHYSDEATISFVMNYIISNRPHNYNYNYNKEIEYLQANENLDVMKLLEIGKMFELLS